MISVGSKYSSKDKEKQRKPMQRIFNRTSELKKRRTLRANLTVEEKIFWEQLRNKKLNGCRFRRQCSIGPYVVDFYCSSIKLAIEIDGGVHDCGSAKEYDKNRDEFIRSLGINLIRFSNEDIRRNLDVVIKMLQGVK
ncbi:MAG: endonuclease domain-containing protein [Spirochaetes bacterium]|nr:endonuclease domain-containing protein [Spirochaetota bacterium]